MIGAATIAALEARKIDYILGARERSSKEVRETVLHDDGMAVPLSIPRQKGETDLAVKGGQGRGPPLYRLSQRGGGAQGC